MLQEGVARDGAVADVDGVARAFSAGKPQQQRVQGLLELLEHTHKVKFKHLFIYSFQTHPFQKHQYTLKHKSILIWTFFLDHLFYKQHHFTCTYCLL